MDIIDIGSNSVRLLHGGKKTVITTMLAKDMLCGKLDAASIARTVTAVEQLFALSDGSCAVFATEAVRKATNKSEFLEAVFKATGLKVQILTGDEEAEIGFLGATAGSMEPSVVLDLGGASCEVVSGQDGRIIHKVSYPFGCVTMSDKFGKDYGAIRQYVRSLIVDLPCFDAAKLIAIGGTATSLAAMAQELDVYDPDKVDGYKLSANNIKRLIAEVDDGKDFPVLIAARRNTINQGATALLAVMERLNKEALVVSERDNLEGYMFKWLR